MVRRRVPDATTDSGYGGDVMKELGCSPIGLGFVPCSKCYLQLDSTHCITFRKDKKIKKVYDTPLDWDYVVV